MDHLGDILEVALAVAAPSLVNKNTQAFSPISYIVNDFALNRISEDKARAALTLLYFAKPLDRAIQALVVPFFVEIEYFAAIVNEYKRDRPVFLAVRLIIIPVAVPGLALYGLIQSVGLVANGAFQLVIPYQTIYALIKGKEASREYFDFINFAVSSQKEYKRICILKPPQRLGGPTVSIDQIIQNYPISQNAEDLFDIVDIVSFASGIFFLHFARYLHPHHFMPLLRATAVV